MKPGTPRLAGLPGRLAPFLLVALAILLVALAASWPLGWDLEDTVYRRLDEIDRGCSIWHPWSLLRRLADGGLSFQAPELYWPQGLDTGPFLWNLAVALLQAPFYYLAHPFRAYALSQIFLAFLNGVGGYVLGRVVSAQVAGEAGPRHGPGLAAAFLLAASPYAWLELYEGHTEQGLIAFVALSFAGLLVLRRGGGRREIGATALALAATALCYWFYAYFVAIFFAAIWALSLAPTARSSGAWKRILLAGALSLVVTAPFAAPLLWRLSDPDHPTWRLLAQVQQDLGHNPQAVDEVTLACLAWPLEDCPALPASRKISLLLRVTLVAGATVPALRRRSGLLAGLGLAALLLAMGPFLAWTAMQDVEVGGSLVRLPAALLGLLPGFDRLFWYNRFLALSSVAAAGVVAAAMTLPRTVLVRAAGLAVLAVVASAESVTMQAAQDRPGDGQRVFRVPELVALLGQQPGTAPLFQLPMGRTGYQAWIPYHRQPVDGGLGDANPRLRPGWYAESLAGSENLQLLSRISGGATVTEPRPGLEEDLCDKGFRYLLIWRDQRRPVDIAPSVQAVLGRKADVVDAQLSAWRLLPCGVDLPVSGSRVPEAAPPPGTPPGGSPRNPAAPAQTPPTPPHSP